MSRTEKRAGRARYDKRGATDEWIQRDNAFKALFGKHFKHPMAEQVFLLGAVDKALKMADENPQGFGEKATRKFRAIRLRILWEINQYLSELVEKWDWKAISVFAELMPYKDWNQTADTEAWEIFRAYTGLKERLGHFPSGKDLASYIDECRAEEGQRPSEKSVDAIRERALRLGLKLKGKRKKK